jgi:hypothetical protein
MNEMYKPEQDWLFEKLLWKLESRNHLILIADQGWGIQEYVNELRFQLGEKNPEIPTCFIDIRPTHSSNSFLELFVSAFLNRFPEETSCMELDKSSMKMLNLPEVIAQRHKIRVAVFLANAHLFHRFKDSVSFLWTLKRKFRNQKNCVFCLYGNNSPYFRDLLHASGPLSGLGQLFELKHNPVKHRSASIRKLFYDYKKRIGYNTSVQMSYAVDNNPFYLKLLAWHALLMTQITCTPAILDKSLNNLIQHFDHRFSLIIESLTLKQLNFLKALIEGNRKLYSKSTRDKYQLGSTSNIARIKASLENKGMIQSGRVEIVFTDPIFREWLRRSYFASH